MFIEVSVLSIYVSMCFDVYMLLKKHLLVWYECYYVLKVKIHSAKFFALPFFQTAAMITSSAEKKSSRSKRLRLFPFRTFDFAKALEKDDFFYKSLTLLFYMDLFSRHLNCRFCPSRILCKIILDTRVSLKIKKNFEPWQLYTRCLNVWGVQNTHC